jgi:hypothetical protein
VRARADTHITNRSAYLHTHTHTLALARTHTHTHTQRHTHVLLVQIGTVREPELRVQIVTQRSEFDENPAVFRKDYLESQSALTQKIVEARQRLRQVCISHRKSTQSNACCVNVCKLCKGVQPRKT